MHVCPSTGFCHCKWLQSPGDPLPSGAYGQTATICIIFPSALCRCHKCLRIIICHPPLWRYIAAIGVGDLDNIQVMVIVWRLRGNINRTALCWIVWHNVHSQQHTSVSSSYRFNRLGLSHWDPYTVRRGGCLALYYCNTVEWFWWDSSVMSMTNWFPSVLWHCWFGLGCRTAYTARIRLMRVKLQNTTAKGKQVLSQFSFVFCSRIL